MRRSLYGRQGFTLLELMIVVIIVGILATLAVPRFIGATYRAKEAEAKMILGQIRNSQWRYYLEAEHLFGAAKFTTNINELDISPVTSNVGYNYRAAETASANPTWVGQAEDSTGTLRSYRIDKNGVYSVYTP